MNTMTHSWWYFRRRCYLRVRPCRHCNTDWSIAPQYSIADIFCWYSWSWQVTSVSSEECVELYLHCPMPSCCNAWESRKTTLPVLGQANSPTAWDASVPQSVRIESTKSSSQWVPGTRRPDREAEHLFPARTEIGNDDVKAPSFKQCRLIKHRDIFNVT